MVIIMLGAPGTGKGTIAGILSKNLNIPQVSTGDIFRKHIKEGTELGQLAEKYIYAEKADSLVLGCTELPLAIKPCDVSVPVLNTTEIHIEEIYRKATEK